MSKPRIAALFICLSFFTGVGNADEPAKPVDAPKSPAALAAEAEYAKAKHDADSAYRSACLAAEHKLIAKLRIAMTVATKNGSLPEANAIDREIKSASARVEELSQPAAVNAKGKVVVKFAEDMGYTVAELKKGASSFNSHDEPITDIPPMLDGKMFTQAVRARSSPVHVRFVTAGKLYVMLQDWGGYPDEEKVLKNLLHEEPDANFKDKMMTFHVWSITGTPGQKVEIPYWCVLVADELQKVSSIDTK